MEDKMNTRVGYMGNAKEQLNVPLHNDVKTLQELIEIRDGYKECTGFTQEDINNFITNLGTKQCMFYLFISFLYSLEHQYLDSKTNTQHVYIYREEHYKYYTRQNSLVYLFSRRI